MPALPALVFTIHSNSSSLSGDRVQSNRVLFLPWNKIELTGQGISRDSWYGALNYSATLQVNPTSMLELAIHIYLHRTDHLQGSNTIFIITHKCKIFEAEMPAANNSVYKHPLLQWWMPLKLKFPRNTHTHIYITCTAKTCPETVHYMSPKSRLWKIALSREPTDRDWLSAWETEAKNGESLGHCLQTDSPAYRQLNDNRHNSYLFFFFLRVSFHFFTSLTIHYASNRAVLVIREQPI